MLEDCLYATAYRKKTWGIYSYSKQSLTNIYIQNIYIYVRISLGGHNLGNLYTRKLTFDVQIIKT